MTVSAAPSCDTLAAATVRLDSRPPLSSVVKTTPLPAARPDPASVMVCPVLAAATPALAAVPLPASAAIAESRVASFVRRTSVKS